MGKKTAAGSGNRGNTVEAVSRMIPLIEIEPSPDNVRKQIDKGSLNELAESIGKHGVLQSILLRPIETPKASKAKYRIVAGERRFRAAKLAGLKEIPASVRSMNDEEALDAQIVENLIREDVHPLDEAVGFLRLREIQKLELSGIAQRVAKDERYVARRLALTNLIEVAREDYRAERITLAHALEICRLSPEVQAEALAACYERKLCFDRSGQTSSYQPDKEKPARHVRYLQEWLATNVHLNLHQAPFKTDDGRLREDGLTCVDCPQRSGRNKTLFADITNDSTCLNPPCFQAKLQRFVQIRKAELEEKNRKPAVYISEYYGPGMETRDAIGRDQYQPLEKKVDRCEHAEQAVVADGPEIGHVRWVCREKGCKDHLGRVRDSYARSSGGPVSHNAPSKDRNHRKQELFDIKVDEEARKRVMREAIKTFAWPLDREHLNEAIKEFFRRLPSDVQKTAGEVFGWSSQEAEKLRLNSSAVPRVLADLDDDRLAQFLMLCSFAHYGANQYKNSRVDQSAVVGLSEQRNVNHALIDAEVRAELCPKKYKDTHQAYLEAVKSGKAAKKPVVYECLSESAQRSSSAGAEMKSAD
jgi:ParB family chromosome partitioning protein